MPRLENWSLHFADDNEFEAPEIREQVLCGEIFDDPRFPDGSRVTTGWVMKLDMDERTAETARTKYTLGKLSPLFLEYLRGNGFESYEKLKEY